MQKPPFLRDHTNVPLARHFPRLHFSHNHLLKLLSKNCYVWLSPLRHTVSIRYGRVSIQDKTPPSRSTPCTLLGAPGCLSSGPLAPSAIGFHSLTEAIDTTTAGEGLVFHIFAGLAECARTIIHRTECAP